MTGAHNNLRSVLPIFAAAMPAFQKILIIQTAFIGDVILATGIVEKLHQYYPDAKIDFLLRKGNEALLKGHPFINQILIWDKTKNKYPNLVKMLQQVRGGKYDMAVTLQRFAAAGFLTGFSNAKLKVGFRKNPFSFLFDRKTEHQYNRHETARNHLLIEEFTDGIPAGPRLYPAAADFEKVAACKGGPYICIAPASVWFTKQFPKEKWVEFLNLVPQNLTVYLLGAPGDVALCEAIVRETANPRLNMRILAGQLSLLQTAALMRDAAMNYTNDSAPLHLASAMNAPVRALFCSTVKEFGFGPLSDNSAVIETNLTLDCRPCGLHGYRSCPRGHFKCALTIDAGKMINALENK